MLAGEAKALAQQWVAAEASRVPGFYGAYVAGSVLDLADDESLSPASDLDVMVVLAQAEPPRKPGKFVYQGLLLEVTYLSLDQLRSPEQVLGHYHLAGSLRRPNILADPSGYLTQLQTAVAQGFAQRPWVVRRCEQARQRVEARVQAIQTAVAFPDQVMAWLFAAGGMPHVLLVAGLRNPTVRRRYVAARQLLADYGRVDYAETLLELLGCGQMGREQVAAHSTALAEVFDVAKTVVKTPFFFASDLSDAARPIAIDGSWEMVESGYHREALFWIVATYSRCMQVLAADGTASLQARYNPGYRRLLGDLGIASADDLRQRGAQILAALPALGTVTAAILAANPAIAE